jgi:predicted nucleic acid-binding protein
MNYFFDSYAIIELFKNSPSYEKFKDEIIITSALNLAEVYYIIALCLGENIADKVGNIKMNFIEINPSIALEASKFRFRNKSLKFSYADCIGYLMAKKANLKFLTGDEQFKGFEDVEFVK